MRKAVSTDSLQVPPPMAAPTPRRSDSMFFLGGHSPPLSRSPSLDLPLDDETKSKIKECLNRIFSYVVPLVLSDIFYSQSTLISFIDLQIQFLNNMREVLFPMIDNRKTYARGKAEEIFISLHQKFREEILATEEVVKSLTDSDDKEIRKALENFLTLIAFLQDKIPKVEPKSPSSKRFSAGHFPTSPLSRNPPLSLT